MSRAFEQPVTTSNLVTYKQPVTTCFTGNRLLQATGYGQPITTGNRWQPVTGNWLLQATGYGQQAMGNRLLQAN